MRGFGTGLLSLLLTAPVVGQAVDTVHVTLRDGGAEVEQRLIPDEGTVAAFAMRMDEQVLSIQEVVREGADLLDAQLVTTDRAYRLDVASGAPIRMRYTVTGSTERIPLFVAGGRAELTVVQELEEPFLIRISGDGGVLASLDLPTSVPKFAPGPDGDLEVALSSVPALIRLSRGGAFSFTRVADAVVLVLILAGAIWTWRNARVKRREGVAM